MTSPFRKVAGGGLTFFCPGCKETHAINQAGGPQWQVSGAGDKLTFSPSLLVTSGHFVSTHKAGDACWCTYSAAHPERPSTAKCYRCHSWVRDGQIQFLPDSTHALAGSTVPLPPWPYERGAYFGILEP